MDKQHERPGGIQDPPLYFQPSIGDHHHSPPHEHPSSVLVHYIIGSTFGAEPVQQFVQALDKLAHPEPALMRAGQPSGPLSRASSSGVRQPSIAATISCSACSSMSAP